ncbi:MAG: phosphatase PAP2 family protein [Candidatus Aenigmarchaeota archaeon]|nr:phosphatase PAP2 family protein [Candidatus Aenigmarchaeota archaeon]
MIAQKLAALIEEKPFHMFFLVILILNISGIVPNSNYATAVAVLASLISVISSVAVKLMLKTKRPGRSKKRILKAEKYGFPSSHTQIAFSIATTYSYYAPNLSPHLFLIACFIAAARMNVKAHYMKDVVGGAILGVVSGAIAIWTIPTAPVF